MLQKILSKRILILLLLFLIVPLGLFSKAYTGIGQEWIRDYSGDVLYEIFWCLFIFWFVQRRKDAIALRNITIKIALWVFAITCMVEVSQLWFYLVPVALRSTFIWRMLLGAGFDWWDFLHYAFGSLIGWWMMKQIGQIDDAL
ncbi:MAG: DUF2809 domain-containing protein [Cyanobacteria bacterium J06621_12]